MTARRAALAAAAALALGGCGLTGGGGIGEWRAEADAICDRTERTIRGREPATSGADLQRALVLVRDDVRAAAADIRELEVPDEARDRVTPFVAELGRLERRLDAIEPAARDAGAIRRQADRLRLESFDLQERARDAGLRRCGRAGQGDAAADAVQMPVYASQVATVVERLIAGAARVERTVGPPRGSKLQRARYWAAMIPVAERARYSFDKQAPLRVDDEAEELGDTLFNLLSEAESVPGSLFPARPPGFSSPADVARTERAASRLLARAQRLGIELLEATGAPGEALLPDVRAAGR